MIEDNGGNGFSLLGMLLLAAFSTVLWETVPLDSSRPSSKKAIDYQNHVSAKLWQDPFKAIFEDPQVKETIKQAKQPKSNPFSTIPPCVINRLVPHWKNQMGEIRILSVMVNIREDADSEERRRRSRYAVLSGLGEANYVPEQTTQIKFCKWETADGAGVKDYSEIIVPYELFKTDCKSISGCQQDEGIVLLWLNEARFQDAPLESIRILVKLLVEPEPDSAEQCVDCEGKCSLFVLGPERSQTLKNLAVSFTKSNLNFNSLQSLIGQHYKKIKGIHILSPSATAQLFTQKNNKFKKQIDALAPNNRHAPPVTFLRTIQTDNELTKILVKELVRRGLKQGKSKVALISEWDTLFGRTLPESFSAAYCGEGSESESCNKSIYRYSYLHGIDGHYSTYISTKTGSNKPSESNAADILEQEDRRVIRRPSGTGQFDYLRRLAMQIKQVDRNERAQDKQGIRAIGILGSDVYDKLLILRTLRAQFPGVLFFTTDLDAQLLHPGDFRWTRNLIVASAFNLFLDKEVQGKIPPFRDSYQTSKFLSTLMVAKFNYPNILPECSSSEMNGKSPVHCPDFKSNKYLMDQLQPLLFEVGRNGAVLLGQNGNTNKASLHQAVQKPRYLSGEIITVFFVLLLACVLIFKLYPKSDYRYRKWQLFGVFVFLSLLCLLAIVANQWALLGEPFSFTDGVSIWPTIFIRIGCLSLCCYFIYRALWLDLEGDNVSSDMYKSSNNTKIYIGTSIGLFCLLAAAGGVAINKLEINQFQIVSYWLAILLFGAIIYFKRVGFKTADILLTNQFMKACEYEQLYQILGCRSQRFIRTIMLWLLFFMMAALIISLTGPAAVPVRGETELKLDRIVLISCVWTMLFLIYFVVDAFRLCFYWIKGIRINKNLNWSCPELDRLCEIRQINSKHAVVLMKIHLIADETEKLCKLIYYPFIIIMVMLLSRSNYFDNWGLPQALAIVVGINIFMLVLSGRRIRYEAEQFRSEAVHELKNELWKTAKQGEADDSIYTITKIGKVMRKANFQPVIEKAETAEYTNELKFTTTKKQIKLLIEEITELRKGVFQPFTEQPMVRASLLLLGAIGLSIGEYALMFG